MRRKRSFYNKIKNFFWQEIDEDGNPIKHEEYEEEYEEDIKIYTIGDVPSGGSYLIAAILVFAAFVLAFSGYLFATHWFGSGIAHGGDGKPLDIGGLFSKKDNIEKILIIGVDERPGEGARADTVVLAIINTTNPELKLLSIPRDTRVVIPRRGNDKINHAQAYGGAKLLTETVSDFLDIKVDKYVQLNFNSFKEVVDILGGIEYTVERRMFYRAENIDLRAGKQILNGDKALQYVRFRSDGRGDVGRVERQQKFMMEFIDQKLELKNVLKIPELAGEISRSVRTNLSIAEMVSIAMAMKDLETEKVHTEMLPGEPRYIGGVSYWIPSTQNLDEIFIKETEDSIQKTQE
ncbi:MAG: LCP family protein [Peptococcaceae bacterium]|nr:LCP family protein [Peptococcaceae bacterium]